LLSSSGQANFVPDMKNLSLLLVLIFFALICSCQKQDSAAEQELAQRKTELDARENALDERMNALDEKVKALDQKVKMLAENQKAMANAATSLSDIQGGTPDPAQEQAERERIQQLATEMRARMADPSRLKAAKAEKERLSQERRVQSQRAIQPLQSQRPQKSKLFSGAVFPAPATNPTAPSSTVETTAPTSSAAEEAASPTPSPTPQ
jgi:vacuolar-type H+-ATPase subunit I/STV1